MNNKGFTLIELLVVMVILGLLSALVAQGYFRQLDEANRFTKTQLAMLEGALVVLTGGGLYPR